MDFLLEHDHEEIGGILRDLLTAIDMCAVKESFRLLDLFWARLAVHIRAENLCLFPAILNGLTDDRKDNIDDALSLEEAEKSIEQLRADHEFFMREVGEAIKQMRQLSALPGSPSTGNILKGVRGRVAAVSRRLGVHNQLEEEQVYRWAGKLLNLREQTRLAARLRHEIENLPPRFGDQMAVRE